VTPNAPPETQSGLYDETYFVGGTKSNYADYAEVEEAIDVGFMPVVRRYAAYAGAGKVGKTFLDVGCAYGFYVERLANLGWRAAGVDVSRYAIDRGLERGVANLQVAPAQALPFPDHSFDYVTSIDVIEHLPSADAAAAVRETHRVLKPGGLTLYATPNYLSNPHWNVFTPGFEDPDVTHINYQSVESLRALFTDFSSCHIYGNTPFVEQFHAFDTSGAFDHALFRIRPLRNRVRRIAWKLLGRSVEFSSYLHAVAVK
jgi:SAM-dependent methyltransferase